MDDNNNNNFTSLIDKVDARITKLEMSVNILCKQYGINDDASYISCSTCEMFMIENENNFVICKGCGTKICKDCFINEKNEKTK